MKLGIVGLPNVGKSTLFNAITNAGADAANYPFCTIDPNIGIAAVPDSRLAVLAQMVQPEKCTPAVIEFVDIAGLVKGASKGEGLGNQFLSHIREVDAIVHVVRCFENHEIAHVNGKVDPAGDVEIINLELIYSDIEMITRKIDRAKKALKGDRSVLREIELFERLLDLLNKGKGARFTAFSKEERELLKTTPLLSAKPVIYAANIKESDLLRDPADNPHYAALKEIADLEGARIITVCAELESQIAELEEREKKIFLTELGINVSGLDNLVGACYSLLGLISYLTAGPKEVRAWTIKNGTKAPEAAGKIHSDFEKGFIRAEIVPFDDLVACGSAAAAREKGLLRSEGRDYVIKDGDVVLFRFNV